MTASGESNANNDTSTVQFTIAAATTTPSQQWRYQYFNTTANSGNAADTANPAGDGINNLTKYALGLDPTKAQANPITLDTSTGYLQLTAPKNANATDITYSVQVSSDLTSSANWTNGGVTTTANTTTRLRAHDNTAVGSVPKHFIRLQISR